MLSSLTVKVLAQQILGNLLLPLVTIREELLLVVQQLFMGFSSKLKIRTLHNGIDGTGLLAVAAVDALGHVNIVPGGPAGRILSLLGVDGNGLGGTGGLAQLARDAPLVTGGITAEGMFTTKARTEVSLLEGVVDGDLGFHGGFEAEDEASPYLRHEENFGGSLEYVIP